MLKKDIFDAYERVKPDEAAKQRMLENICAMAAEEKQGKREREGKAMKKQGKRKIKKVYYWAAAAAVAMLVPITAAAAHLLGLWDMGLGKQKIEVPMETQQGEYILQPDGNVKLEEQEVDMVSIQGVEGSPEYMACMEWQEFLEGYDTDEKILEQIGDRTTGFEEEYGEYLCYTQEMADKIDEICEKYGLSKLNGFTVAESYEDFCGKTGIGNVCEGAAENAVNTFTDGYYYADGSFLFGGTAAVTGASACTTDYEFSRVMKGTFDASVLNVGDLNDYRQWEYQTKSGEKVLLANSSHKGLIIAERENSFNVVNVLGNIIGDSYDVSDEALEVLAESFDFSML